MSVMWRAIAGLAAIAVMSECATTPTPIHRAEGKKQDPPAADDIYWPTQESVSATVGETVRGNCGGDAAPRYGSVQVVVRRGSEDRPLIETEKPYGLNEDDRTCVSSEVSKALESLRRQWQPDNFWGYLGTNVVRFSVTLGTAPLVPPSPPPEF